MSPLASGHLAAAAKRVGIVVTLVVSALVHAKLFVGGYRYVPVIGPAFLLQASVFLALAALIAAGGPRWLQSLALVGALGSVAAFAGSRTVGIFGFTEHGWQPAPLAITSVIAEALVVALCAAALPTARAGTARRS